MTDGIIQKVFFKPDNTFAKQIIDNFQSDYANMILDYYKQSLERKEQELIGKIKQEFNDEGYLSHNTETLKKLIGNNKE